MIQLTASEILENSGWLMYKRGASYYQEGAVVNINRYGTSDPRFTHIFARVTGSRSWPYEVKLTFSKQTGDYLEGQCSCPAYKDGVQVCKHMVAVMFETIEKYTNNRTVWNKGESKSKDPDTAGPMEPTSQQIQQANSFVDNLLEQVTEEETLFTPSKEPLYVQFELEGIFTSFTRPKDLELSLKVGTNRLYVVKDIGEFVDAWYAREPMFFTPHYTYEPDQMIMAEEDARVLEYLYPLVKSQQYFKDSDFYYAASMKKSLQLPNHFIDGLFPLLEDCDAVVMKRHKEDLPFHIIHDRFPESFILSKEGGHFSLTIKDTGFISKQIADSGYFVKNETIYSINESIRQTVTPLYNHLSEKLDNTQLFQQEHIEQMAGTVFPVLEAHNLLEVDDSITDKLKRYECYPVVKLTKQDSSLHAHLVFEYGDEKINPFQTYRRNPDMMISRNMKKERQVMNLIEQANFHWNGEVLSLSGGHDLGHFFYVILPELTKRAEVITSEEVDDMYNDIPEEIPLALDVDENYGWFEVRFPTEDLTDSDISSLLQSLKDKENYHQFSNGRIIDLEEDAWEETRSLFEQLDIDANQLEDGVVQLPKYRALQVDTSTGVQQSEAFKQLVEAIQHPETLAETPPDTLQANLRDYQLRGFQWLRSLARHGFGGVLADEMGLGKTLQGLAYILAGRKERPDHHPFLVVSPSSLIYNWEQEASKFTPNLSVRVVSGSKEERTKQMEDLSGVDLVITSYPMLRRDTDLYLPYFFQGVLLDEAQSFKNHTSLTYKAVRAVRAETAFALTGTPVENRAEELWTLFSVVMPGLLYDRKTFKTLEQSLIQKKISPFVLRRTKKEVLTELPDKIQTTRYTDLTKEQRQLYVGYLQEIQQQTKNQLQSGGFQQNRMQILSNLTRLRQLCCHPSLFVDNYEGESGKLEELRSFLQEARANGQRLLIFSQFTSMLDLIAQAVEEEQFSYFYLDGSTPSQDRVHMASRFNEGEKDMFLISLKAGGTGLNLVGADTVVLYDLWWNPAVEQQAADRAHRIGQKNSVQVVKMIAKGTIEEKIQALQEKKQNLFDTLIQSGEGNLSALTEDDIRDILSI
ncbi:SNF2 helicase associated domain-containing protein [Pontibacillus salicampi]|uniref:SNF2 helicase associated domain-containing protein n=1 Tax=Pontibacillus salicampi TaxID=1449801 RepID=A0ABV6LSI4_9BACI